MDKINNIIILLDKITNSNKNGLICNTKQISLTSHQKIIFDIILSYIMAKYHKLTRAFTMNFSNERTQMSMKDDILSSKINNIIRK